MTSLANTDVGSLRALFSPRSIAIIGASDDPTRIGGRPLHYLTEIGFTGAVYPVNPGRDQVQGRPAYHGVRDIGEPIDLAILAVPAPAVIETIQGCADVGVRAAIVFTAGFAELGEEGAAMQDELTRIGRRGGMRILGPNCLGAMNLVDGVIATFSNSIVSGAPFRGRIGFVSQSGAFGSHCFAAARERGLGFSYWVTTGNECDIEFSDCLHYLAEDPDTDVIVAYLEGCHDGDKLAAALRVAHERRKPVVMMKVGRSSVGAAAAASHTGSLVGSDSAFDAVFDRYNVARAATVAQLLDLAAGCESGVYPPGDRVALITVSGGVGILMADAAEAAGLAVAAPPARAQRLMREALPYAAVGNPVDTTAQAINDPGLVARFLDIMLGDAGYDSAAVFLTHLGLSEWASERIRVPLTEARQRHPDKLVVVSMLSTPAIRQRFIDSGFLVVEDPTAAVETIAALTRIRSGLSRPTPAQPPTRTDELPAAPPAGSQLSEHEAIGLLARAGIPAPAQRIAHSADEAVDAAHAVGLPVVMKIATAEVGHKTDVGGVVVGADTDADIRAAFARLTSVAAAISRTAADAGVLVATMCTGGVETIVGVHHDPTFGPLVMLGLGGTAVEAFGDVTFALPPLTPADGEAMIDRLRGRDLLRAPRGGRPLDTDALGHVLAAVSHLAVAWRGAVRALEINPLLVLPAGEGALALDALIVPGPP